MEEKKRGRGRPKCDKPKYNKVSFRLDDDDYQKLLDYSSEHGLTLAEVIKSGLKKVLDSEE